MFSISRINRYLEFESGSKAGELLLPIIPTTFFLGITASFGVVLISACLAGLKKSMGIIVLVGGTAGIAAAAVDLFSPLVGANMYDSFLDGFEGRVILSGVASNAVIWADHVFANANLNTNKFEEMHFSGQEVPPFLRSLFADSPEIIVYYGNDKAEQIEVRRSEGIDWGLLLVRDTNSLSAWQRDQKPRYCGNGLYVFVHFYK